MIKLKNPYYMNAGYMGASYNKNEILAQIPNDSIVGLGYTSYSTKTFNGNSIYENDEYEDIYEYVIINAGPLCITNLAYMPIDAKTFFAQTEEGMGGVYEAYLYKEKLKELGYICLPDNFRRLKSDTIRNLFETNKTKSKTKLLKK